MYSFVLLDFHSCICLIFFIEFHFSTPCSRVTFSLIVELFLNGIHLLIEWSRVFLLLYWLEIFLTGLNSKLGTLGLFHFGNRDIFQLVSFLSSTALDYFTLELLSCCSKEVSFLTLHCCVRWIFFIGFHLSTARSQVIPFFIRLIFKNLF